MSNLQKSRALIKEAMRSLPKETLDRMREDILGGETQTPTMAEYLYSFASHYAPLMGGSTEYAPATTQTLFSEYKLAAVWEAGFTFSELENRFDYAHTAVFLLVGEENTAESDEIQALNYKRACSENTFFNLAASA